MICGMTRPIFWRKQMFAVINDSLAISSITDLTKINNMQKQGYQSLIDLCPTAEGNQLNAVDIKAQ
ncbi:hypothetical protein PL11201_560006 [Planktothrix sp. PCC 11201]|nr:hypothetical protein PL11201_560006 [Planktothrix sp. PCC 11201]